MEILFDKLIVDSIRYSVKSKTAIVDDDDQIKITEND